MEWQQIVGFYNVTKLKSFTRAAEATYRTQSAITQQVKALEEELDCRLFERIGKRKFLLTPFGERFYSFAETLIQERERLIGDIAKYKGLKKGRLRAAAPFTTLYHLLPEVIGRYSKQFPWVELSLHDRPQREVIELVKEGDVDFGLALEDSIPNDLSKRRWKKVEPVLLTPQSHPLSKVKKISFEAISQYPLILPPKSGEFPYRNKLDELFLKRGLNCFVIMESSNVELSALYVENGLGVSFASVVKGLRGFGQRKLRFVSLSHLIPADYICVTTRRDKILESFQEAFVKMLFSS